MPLTTYTAGEVLTAASLNANFTFAAANPTAPEMAIFNETQANNTQGGTFTAGSYVKRTLNTTLQNTITSCTLTSSVISLPAGTYEVTAVAPATEVNANKLRLQDTTTPATLIQGQNTFASGFGGARSNAPLQGVFTITATTNVELQHRCGTTITTNGLGTACNFSDNEIYATIQIVKLA
jgi:hypothetical protein